MNIEKLIEDYKDGNLSVEDNILSTLEKIENDELNAYISIDREGSIKRAKKLDEKIKNGEKLGSLFGVPVAVKDNISYDKMKML